MKKETWFCNKKWKEVDFFICNNCHFQKCGYKNDRLEMMRKRMEKAKNRSWNMKFFLKKKPKIKKTYLEGYKVNKLYPDTRPIFIDGKICHIPRPLRPSGACSFYCPFFSNSFSNREMPNISIIRYCCLMKLSDINPHILKPGSGCPWWPYDKKS